MSNDKKDKYYTKDIINNKIYIDLKRFFRFTTFIYQSNDNINCLKKC